MTSHVRRTRLLQRNNGTRAAASRWVGCRYSSGRSRKQGPLPGGSRQLEMLCLVRSLIVVVAISLSLAACGDRGGGQPRAAVGASEIIGGGCSSSASGSSNGQTQTTSTTCRVVFDSGEQFSCPEGVTARTPAGVASASGCRRIAPVRFPAAWKVVLHQIAAVRDCLRHRGDRVIENVVTSGLPGGSPSGTDSGNPRLVGELVVSGAAPAFIGFTLQPPFSGARTPPGWRVRRHGNVAVISQNPGAVSGCAFAG